MSLPQDFHARVQRVLSNSTPLDDEDARVALLLLLMINNPAPALAEEAISAFEAVMERKKTTPADHEGVLDAVARAASVLQRLVDES